MNIHFCKDSWRKSLYSLLKPLSFPFFKHPVRDQRHHHMTYVTNHVLRIISNVMQIAKRHNQRNCSQSSHRLKVLSRVWFSEVLSTHKTNGAADTQHLWKTGPLRVHLLMSNKHTHQNQFLPDNLQMGGDNLNSSN